MSKIAILTDSSCDIPQEMAEKYGIENNARICELHRKCNKYL